MQDNNYTRFGDQWKKEMMKWNKTALIDFLAKTLKDNHALKASGNPALDFQNSEKRSLKK